jgi:bacterioferritin (cytochrome b1)
MRRQQKEKSEAVGLARKRKQEKSFEELLRQEEENHAGKMDEQMEDIARSPITEDCSAPFS